MQPMTRILIADDHDVVRSGLRAILEAQPNWEVVAEAADGREAISLALKTTPQVAILDYAMPLINGVEATRQIRARSTGTEVLIFTLHESEALIRDLLQAGARGYLLKSDAKRHLLTAVEMLAMHKPFFTGQVSEALLKSFLGSGTHAGPLTPRERSVVQLIAEGHSNKCIASVLNLSVKTIETHRAAALRKLNLNSSAALIRYAVRNNIVQV